MYTNERADPVKLTPSEIHSMVIVRDLLAKAAAEFNKLSGESRDSITMAHSQDTSVTHCLRWGEQNADEIIDQAKSQAQKKSSKAMKP